MKIFDVGFTPGLFGLVLPTAVRAKQPHRERAEHRKQAEPGPDSNLTFNTSHHINLPAKRVHSQAACLVLFSPSTREEFLSKLHRQAAKSSSCQPQPIVFPSLSPAY